MTTIKDIATVCETWAPLDLAEDWDNCGLQIGDPTASVTTILVALEVDRAVLDYIQTHKVDLVITHHPLFFNSIKQINYHQDIGRIIRMFIQTGTALLSYHTNLDRAEGGVNDCLVSTFGLDPNDGQPFENGFGKWFEVSNKKQIDQVLPMRVAGYQQQRTIKRIGFCAGSGKSLMNELIEKSIDVFITGEMGYHDEVTSDLNEIQLWLCGHKESEVIVLPEIKNRVLRHVKSCEITVI